MFSGNLDEFFSIWQIDQKAILKTKHFLLSRRSKPIQIKTKINTYLKTAQIQNGWLYSVKWKLRDKQFAART